MKIVGVINKITNYSIQKKILIYVSSNKGYIPVLAKRSLISKNMPVTIEGTYSGKYFVAEDIKLNFFNATAYAKYLTAKSNGCGFGYKTILKFTRLYKASLLNVSKEDLRAKILGDFKTINVNKLDEFLEAIYKKSTISLLEDYLEEYEIDYDMLEKIDTEYGIDAVKKFKENPYIQCSYFGLKINLADFIAKRENIESLNSKRISGYIANELVLNEQQGNTYIDAKKLAEKVLYKINRSFAYKDDEKCFPIHIANCIATNKKFLILDDGKVFLRKTYKDEKIVASRLLTLNSTFKSYITVTDEDILKIEESLNIKLGKEQKCALKMLEQNGVLILTGGPGVGKTATINAITALFKSKVPSGLIKYCAPTGRAAKRLSESVNDEAVTIHKMVELQPFEKETMAKKCAANPIKADFIIVDETSMADISIMAILLNAIENGTRLLLVGDEFQLPSVGCGNFLHDIIASKLFDVYKLNKNYRQLEDSSIIDNSKLINKGKKPISNDNDFIIKEFEDNTVAKKYIENLASEEYDMENPFNFQIIEPTNDEVYKTNKWIHNHVINNFDDSFISYGLNDKIMFKINKYEESEDDGLQEILYANGEMGVITYIDNDEVVVSDGENEKVLPVDIASDISLAFSCTIHKSQGSEYDTVVIYLPDNADQMMIRPLLYTAVTRAKRKVVIISVSNALERCINNIGTPRKTYLFTLLREAA